MANYAKVKNELRRLDTASAKRLANKCRSLSKDRDKVVFDDKVRDLLLVEAKDPRFIKKIVDQLDSVKFCQSKYEYSKIEEQLFRFSEPNHTYFGWNRNYKQAKSEMIAELKNSRLISLRYRRNKDLIDALPVKSTHPGFSAILTGLLTKGDYMTDTIYQDYKKVESQAKEVGSMNRPILPGVRTQATIPYNEEYVFNGEWKSKSRLVSMIDIYQILAELKFSKPIQAILSSKEWYAGGKDDSHICSIIRGWHHRHQHHVTIDYSKYDQSISDWLIRDAFEIMRVMFVDSGFDNELYKIVREDFINKVFIDGKGQVIESHKGVPSGSMFTQIVDSIVNRLMIKTYLISKNMQMGAHMMIMGDDNIIFTRDKIDLEDLAGYLTTNFGIVVNAEKCNSGGVKDNPEFLSRTWRCDGVWRHPIEILAKLLYPERFRDYFRTDINPELMVYSYCLVFPRGMDELLKDRVDFMERSRALNKDLDRDAKYLTFNMKRALGIG